MYKIIHRLEYKEAQKKKKLEGDTSKFNKFLFFAGGIACNPFIFILFCICISTIAHFL